MSGNDPNKTKQPHQSEPQQFEYQYQFQQQQQQNHQKQPHSPIIPQKQIKSNTKDKHQSNTSAKEKNQKPQMNAPTNNFKIEDQNQSNEPQKFENQQNLLHMEIKQKKQNDFSENSNGNNSIKICIEDSDAIPSVHLEKSPKGHSFTFVKIPMYRTTTFMKLQTQVFLLEIFTSSNLKDYQIERRYSEFVQLYEQIFYNYPGYILSPFPDKGIQSFMKIKLGLGTEQPGERCEMIQRRMQSLEKFINFVTHHQQLCNSEQAHVFLTEKTEQYEQGKKRLQKYLNENRSLEKRSTMKSIIGAGRSFFNSYFKAQKKQVLTQMTFGKNDINLTIIYENIQSSKGKFKQKLKIYKDLYSAEKNFSDFADFSTENDVLLKVCAKHSSGKNFCSKFADFILIKVLDECQYNIKQLQQAEKVLEYRKQIWQSLQSSKKEGNEDKKAKLTRRIEMLETNFLNDWQHVNSEIEKRKSLMENDFIIQWETYKKQMKKIWKTQAI